MDLEKFTPKSKNKLSQSSFIDVEGTCTTTEDFENSLLDDMEEFKAMVNQIVDERFEQNFEQHLSEKVQVVIDLALEAYELKKKRESSKQEYKLVKKNVKSSNK